MNSVELFGVISELTVAEEVIPSSINPEIRAMNTLLETHPELTDQTRKFLREVIAFSIEHFQEPRIRPEDRHIWWSIKEKVQSELGIVPQVLVPLPFKWRKIRREILRLYKPEN